MVVLKFAIIEIYSQQRRLNDFISSIAPFDVSVSIPKKYSIINVVQSGQLLNINNDIDYRGSQMPFVAAVESNDGKAAILFPLISDVNANQIVKLSRYIEGEIRASYNDKNLDVSPYITFITKGMSDFCNADTAVIYPLKLRSQAFNKFGHCVGVYLRKYGHPALLLKIVMTPDAYLLKDKYIKKMLKVVKYGNNPNDQLLNMEQNFAIQDFQFPSPFKANESLFRPDPAFEALKEVWHEGGQEAMYFLTGGDSERVVKIYKTKVMMHKFMTGSDLSPVDSIFRLYWDKGGKEAQEILNKAIGKNH